MFLLKSIVCLWAIWTLLEATLPSQISASNPFKPVQAISPGRLDKLSRDRLLQLDYEVSEFYIDSLAELDSRNVTFEQQLYRSIRSVRHTNIVNHFDYRYTSNATKWKSMGARVNRRLCKRHLRALVSMVNSTKLNGGPLEPTELPLSAFDFIHASGHTGSGVLNGNFAWLGSATSCEHAAIPARVVHRFAPPPKSANGRPNEQVDQLEESDLAGRYCVAHLRAKSWPEWDEFFGDRITIKRGLCLPEACHTALHDDDAEIQRHVSVLALANLLAPFNDHAKFQLSHLYCLPDEDSEFRQLDLGSKLLLAFLAFWALLTVWANIKHEQRRHALRKLRDTVDIRMIINDGHELESPPDCRRSGGASSPKSKPVDGAGHKDDDDGDDEHGEKKSKSLDKEAQEEGEAKPLLASSSPTSGRSSAVATPLPSDIEDDDDDSNLNVLEPFKGPAAAASASASKRRAASGSNTGGSTAESDGADLEATPMDFIRALSIEGNLHFLLHQGRAQLVRPNASGETPSDGHEPGQASAGAHQQSGSHARQGGGKQSAGSLSSRSTIQVLSTPIGRRSSSSNEALVKDLQRSEREAKVAIVTSHRSGENRTGAGPTSGEQARRVNIEVLDGLKVIATCYIVYGHTMMFFFGCITDMRFAVERMFDFTIIATINGLQVVGLFYIITGCLLTYFSFGKTRPNQLKSPLFWLLVLIGRYCRLIPAYALVFWFARHLAPYTGSGRDWYDYRTDEEHARGYCGQESWSVMLTMSAADVKIPMDCVPQAWYLSDDFRTLMVLPLYIFLMATSARLGYAAIFATFGASFWKLAAILKAANIDYKIMLLWHPHVYALMTDRLHDVYTNFLVRISTYLLGVILGHLLYLYEIRYIRHWPRWFTRYGMKAAVLVATSFFFGAPILSKSWLNQFLPDRQQLDSDTVVWIIPLFKSAMELSICVILILLVTGGGNRIVRQLLGSRAMKILSNISYAVFLTHVELMYKIPATQYESNYWYLFLYAGFYITISHLLAFFLHLLWEVPVNNLTRNLFKRAYRAIS